jgi:DNA modification methylase
MILTGDVFERLREISACSIQTCVTSPPYWGLRDYAVEGQIGLEKTPEEYVEKIVEVFRGVWRVLRDDGTCWLNIGDSYVSTSATKASGLNPKDLCLIPFRLALALQADGWCVRSDIAWCKKSSMPESVTDRPTSAWEHIFLLTKSQRYYYDAEAVKMPVSPGSLADPRTERGKRGTKGEYGAVDGNCGYNPSGANLRNYWLLGPEPFSEAHFATFPSEIPRRCIRAGTSEKGCCEQCGAPRERISESKTTDWQPTCSCDAEVIPCTVLDPFLGSGTTAMVAQELDRRWVGIELNPEYVEIAERRIPKASQTSLAL